MVMIGSFIIVMRCFTNFGGT